MNLNEMCDRAAASLYDQPAGQERLGEIASVLLPVCKELERAADEMDALHGPTMRMWAVRLGAAASERRLYSLCTGLDQCSDAEIVWTLDRVLRVLVCSLRVLDLSPFWHKRAS